MNKYRNVPKNYKGRMYDSGLEAGFAVLLDSMLQQGLLKSVVPQFKLVFLVNGHRITTHIVDFLVERNDGKKVFVEAKGFKTNKWVIQRKLAEALYSEIPYLVNPTERQILYA